MVVLTHSPERRIDPVSKELNLRRQELPSTEEFIIKKGLNFRNTSVHPSGIGFSLRMQLRVELSRYLGVHVIEAGSCEGRRAITERFEGSDLETAGDES